MLLSLLLIVTIFFNSCSSRKDFDYPHPLIENEGMFDTVHDGTKIFVYNHLPKENSSKTIYILSGITGINHNKEKDIIELLSNNKNRIVVIHPRGTGFSEGKRGDIDDFSTFINDYTEIINNDITPSKGNKVILYGHSMSCAVALHVAEKLKKIDGLILINPPYKTKQAKGMTPSFSEYIKYAFYYVFDRHKPVVNMAGDPEQMQNLEERNEAIERLNDPLLVKYFSLYLMIESRKMMDQMVDKAKDANYPLLLLFGTSDSIVDKMGCDDLFFAWKNRNKKFELIENGPHGKLTVLMAADIINNWVTEI